MRIIAFDVRPDERAEFERQAARPEVGELVCREEPLSAETAELARGFDAVPTGWSATTRRFSPRWPTAACASW